MTEEEFLAALRVMGVKRERAYNKYYKAYIYVYWCNDRFIDSFYIRTDLTYEKMLHAIRINIHIRKNLS